MDLMQTRAIIDEVDRGILELFCRRMDLARDVARAKMNTGMPVFDPTRERAKLHDVAERAPDHLKDQAVALFSLLMSMNKAEQLSIMSSAKEGSRAARSCALAQPLDTAFPSTATVCCLGAHDDRSQLAAYKVLRKPDISFAPTPEDVFHAVATGSCEFGVLPIEASASGLNYAVYDLLESYGCSIVRSARLNAEQGAQHPQAICTRFVVISGTPAVYLDATRSSIRLTLTNDPGALNRVLERIFALNIDMLRLDSRPVPDSDFERKLYVDLSCPAASPAFPKLLDSLEDVCSDMAYLGSYSEIL